MIVNPFVRQSKIAFDVSGFLDNERQVHETKANMNLPSKSNVCCSYEFHISFSRRIL